MVSSVSLPAGWRVVDPSTLGLPSIPLAVVGPPGHAGYAPSVVVTVDPRQGQVFEAWAQSVVENSLAVHEGSRLLDLSETTVDGLDALWILMVLVLDGRNLTQTQYLVGAANPSGEWGVQVTTTCSTADHPAMHATVEELVAGLRLGEVLP